ncbi:hypothetical protein SBA_ch2_7720 [Sphingomonas bisphenolicum]|uniref:Lytic transglycosylase domain-containing protein n=1 Tax=Sphingomonas bisphenolicum TaxID=296544 RepID=A0ABM7GAF7_9SPHN|nr:hypothetical protein SBA_ch2_7720 [Sphingomonas bisphenolicum]
MPHCNCARAFTSLQRSDRPQTSGPCADIGQPPSCQRNVQNGIRLIEGQRTVQRNFRFLPALRERPASGHAKFRAAGAKVAGSNRGNYGEAGRYLAVVQRDVRTLHRQALAKGAR